MPGELKATLRLTADSRGFSGEIRSASGEVDRLGKRTGTTTKETRNLSGATSGLASRFKEAHGPLLKYAAGLGLATVAYQSLTGTLRRSDAFTSVANSVRLATESATEYAAVQQGLFDIAHRTRQPIEAIADLYQKLSLSADELGVTQERLLAAVEGVGQALVVNGTSASQASGALLQFSQALAGDVVRAEEFNSVLEGAKPILIAVANNLDKAGGSVARLRQLVAEGKVTSREFFEAYEAGLPELQENFEQTSSTIGGALTQVDNAMTNLVGTMDSATGASEGIAGALENVAENLAATAAGEKDFTALTVAAGLLTLAIANRLGPSLLGAAQASTVLATATAKVNRQKLTLRQFLAVNRRLADRGTQSALRLARAYRIQAVAMSAVAKAGSRLLLLMGGLPGVAALVAFALYDFATATQEAGDAQLGLRSSLDETGERLEKLRKKWDDLTAAQRQNEVLIQRGRVEKAQTAVADVATAVADATDDLAEQKTAKLRLQATNERNKNLSGDQLAAAKEIYGEAGVPELKFDSTEEERIVTLLTDLGVKGAVAQENLEAAQAALKELQTGVASGKLPPPNRLGGGDDSDDPPPVSADYTRLVASYRNELEKLDATLAAETALIEANTAAGSEAKETLLKQVNARYKQRVAALDGSAALAAVSAETERLTDQTGLNTEQIELVNRASDRELELKRSYPAATAKVLADLRKEYAERDRLLAQRERESELLARFAAAGEITRRRDQSLADIDNLKDSEHLDPAQAATARAQVRLEAEQEIQQAELELRQGAWDQELLELQGFHDMVEQAEREHAERLIEIKSGGFTRIAEAQKSALALQTAFDKDSTLSATQKAQTGLQIAEKGLANLARVNKKFFKVQQVAAVANATITTAQGVASALKKGFPLGLIEGALIAAAGAAEIASIRAQQPPQGFARGGVVDGATAFAFERERRVGFAGEAGPEAILPLRRLGGGELGVVASVPGVPGRQQKTFAPVISPTVQVVAPPDSDPVEIGDAAGQQIVEVVLAVLKEERRPGGMLNS